MINVIERFSRYVDIASVPKTNYAYSRQLMKEMKLAGLDRIDKDEAGCIYGFLASNIKREVPTVGLLVYIDEIRSNTSVAVTQVFSNYSGNDIAINKGEVLSVDRFTELKACIGDTVYTTDGTSSVSMESKAGVAEILSAIEDINSNPDLKHGEIVVVFIPKSRFNGITAGLDPELFKAKYSFALDGGNMGEVYTENFNKAIAKIKFAGVKGLVPQDNTNAILVAYDFIAGLPQKEIPSKTSGYEGYYHVKSIEGDELNATLEIEICDFDKERFGWRKSTIQNGIYEFTKRYNTTIDFTIDNFCYNMKDKIDSSDFITRIVRQAMEDNTVKMKSIPLRDATLFSNLAYMGVPTPILPTGVCNRDTKLEFIAESALIKTTHIITRIIELFGQI